MLTGCFPGTAVEFFTTSYVRDFSRMMLSGCFLWAWHRGQVGFAHPEDISLWWTLLALASFTIPLLEDVVGGLRKRVSMRWRTA
jgi:hypothetical protein